VKPAVRTQMLKTFGDVSLALNGEFKRYLGSIMRFLQDAVTDSKIHNPV
jgi:hypothetical protein